VDVLLYGDAVVDTTDLIIPHAALAERRFVLEPLAELASELRHPVTKKTVRELLLKVRDQAVRRIS
jgi:2-amino-4-hydroxy-6-hydroxymethyldihydropteridine diphosphokinase